MTKALTMRVRGMTVLLLVMMILSSLHSYANDDKPNNDINAITIVPYTHIIFPVTSDTPFVAIGNDNRVIAGNESSVMPPDPLGECNASEASARVKHVILILPRIITIHCELQRNSASIKIDTLIGVSSTGKMLWQYNMHLSDTDILEVEGASNRGIVLYSKVQKQFRILAVKNGETIYPIRDSSVISDGAGYAAFDAKNFIIYQVKKTTAENPIFQIDLKNKTQKRITTFPTYVQHAGPIVVSVELTGRFLAVFSAFSKGKDEETINQTGLFKVFDIKEQKWIYEELEQGVMTKELEDMHIISDRPNMFILYLRLVNDGGGYDVKQFIIMDFTKAEAACRQQHGVWTKEENNPLRPHCISQTETKIKEHCEASHGTWHWDEKANKSLCDIPKPIMDCNRQGGEWGIFYGENNARCKLAGEDKRQKDCIRQGGQWRLDGLRQLPLCYVIYNDAKKSCQKGTECLSGKCIVDPSTNDHGMCYGNSSTFGYFSIFGKDMKNVGMFVD